MKYFLYARKSTESEERQVQSIHSQIDECREFAKKEKLKIVNVFSESRAAKEIGRPVFNAMFAKDRTRRS